MIIDARVRPPYGGYVNMTIPYNFEVVEPLSKSLGLEAAGSGKNKSVDEMMMEMKAAGIVKAIIVGRQSPQFGSVRNDEIADLVSKYPETLVGIGGVHPLPIDNAINEIEKCIKKWKFAGIALEPGAASPPMYPNDRNIYPIYHVCQQYKIPIYITVSGFVGPHIGFSDPKFIDQVAVDFPRLRMVIAHAAYPHLHTMLYAAMLRPNIYLLPDLYLPYMPGGDTYVVAANQFLEDRMIFGSAYPIASFDSILNGYKKMAFKKGVLEKVLYHNAAKLFNMY